MAEGRVIHAQRILLNIGHAVAAAGMPLPAPFLQVAARLVYEHARLTLPPGQDDVFALAERLKAENHGRAQAATWQPGDWLKLARLVLEKRRLPTAAILPRRTADPGGSRSECGTSVRRALCGRSPRTGGKATGFRIRGHMVFASVRLKLRLLPYRHEAAFLLLKGNPIVPSPALPNVMVEIHRQQAAAPEPRSLFTF